MNNTRRKAIKEQITIIKDKMKELTPEMLEDDDLEWFFEGAKGEIEDILSDEEDAFDNMPESLQYSERGETAQECIDLLNEAIELFDELIDDLSDEDIEVDYIKEKASEICDALDDVVSA